MSVQHIATRFLTARLTLAVSRVFFQYCQASPRAASQVLSSWSCMSMTCKPPLVQLSNVLLFADSIKCYKSTSSVSESSLLQSDLDLFSDWCSNWNLSLNTTKCNILQLHMKSTSIISSNYCVNGSSVTTSACHEDLGIIVSDDLSWSSHYHYISSSSTGIM